MNSLKRAPVENPIDNIRRLHTLYQLWILILGMIEEQCIEAILERISKVSNVVPEFITVRSFCVEILKMFALTLFAQDSDEGVLLT